MIKKILLCGLVFLGICVSSSSYALDFITIRPYGELGRSMIKADGNRSDKINYAYGGQILFCDRYKYLDVSIGLDLGYEHIANIYSANPAREVNYMRSHLISEYTIKLEESPIWPTFQLGVGANWDLDNDSGHRLVIMLAAGFQIPAGDYISIPILTKVEMLYFSKGVVGTLSIMAGISISFDLGSD